MQANDFLNRSIRITNFKEADSRNVSEYEETQTVLGMNAHGISKPYSSMSSTLDKRALEQMQSSQIVNKN